MYLYESIYLYSMSMGQKCQPPRVTNNNHVRALWEQHMPKITADSVCVPLLQRRLYAKEISTEVPELDTDSFDGDENHRSSEPVLRILGFR